MAKKKAGKKKAAKKRGAKKKGGKERKRPGKRRFQELKGREERVGEYRNASRKADELVDCGQEREAIGLLKKWVDQARKPGDEDYRLFFEAEVIGYTDHDYRQQIKLVERALDWRKREGLELDCFLVRARGVYHELSGNHDKAMKCFEGALKVNPKDGDAMREKGVSLGNKGDEDAAIEWFDKALKVNPKDGDAMRFKGVALSKKGGWDAAIEWFDKALKVNPKDGHAMRQKGVSLAYPGQPAKAIGWFKKALDENPKDDAAHSNWAYCELDRGRHGDAFEHICEAAKLNPQGSADDFRFVCGATGKNFEMEWGQLFAGQNVPVPEGGKRLYELAGFISSIRKAYKKESARFLKQKGDAEKELTDFLQATSRLDEHRSLVMVLRRWNSYTPAIPSTGKQRSRGGGYFVWHRGCGTVIDPGYNFLENFNEAGCRICDVDNVIVTHAHNDHTADFETLLTLLYEYNQRHSEGDHKKVRFFLNNGAFMKFSGMINLKDKMFEKDAKVDRPCIVPGDLAFVYDIAKREFYCCVTEDWCKYEDVDFDLGSGTETGQEGIYYFAKNKRSDFAEDPKYHIERFERDREHHKKLYFRDRE